MSKFTEFRHIYKCTIIHTRCAQTNKKFEELKKTYSAFPTENVNYESNGKKYTVVRHFTGDKKLSKIISELAVSKANRDSGLYKG